MQLTVGSSILLVLALERDELLAARPEIGLQLRHFYLQLLLGSLSSCSSVPCFLEGPAYCLLTRSKLLLVAVKIDLALRQLAFLCRQLLGSKPLLLFNLSLAEEEGFPLLGELLPLLC